MHHFHYINNSLYCEEVPLKRLCDEVGTPVFVYSRETLERHFRIFQNAFSAVDHLICYSMKACSNLAILRLFANLGGGMDIVSGGELYRALKAGVEPSKIVYSGVGKKASEMDEALRAGILMFNVESEEELHVLDLRAQSLGRVANVAMRVNPDVDPQTHPYISTGLKKNKFGIQAGLAKKLYKSAKKMKGIRAVGIDCHIGSQLTELSPFLDAVERLEKLIGALRSDGIEIVYLDLGGGLGIPYDDETPPLPADYGAAILGIVAGMNIKLILEPGRVLVGNAGLLATRVLYRKKGAEKNFVIVDAAMNDLIRPSLYQAHHSVWQVEKRDGGGQSGAGREIADVVGPICESGDFLAKSRVMQPVVPGELLAIMSAGAYGFSMSSNYNSRPRAAEVLVDGDRYYVIRSRETYEDLVRGEGIPSDILETK